MPTSEQARAWYTDNDPTHDFAHILRVLALARHIAAAEGADIEIVEAAVLLHDAQGSDPGQAQARASHHEGSAEFAGVVLAAEDWPPARIAAVQACIRTHRYRTGEVPESLEAKVLFDADKLDAIGAIGAARALAFAARSGQPFYQEPSERFRATGELEEGEARSAYHEYVFKLGRLRDRLHTRTAREIANRRHKFLSDFFTQLGQEMRGEA
ncbi:MAG: HD domain-containing protein [Chloroflexi bacterium]|nr:HD domain-containing protein [Chloroflexota bacterium]